MALTLRCKNCKKTIPCHNHRVARRGNSRSHHKPVYAQTLKAEIHDKFMFDLFDEESELHKRGIYPAVTL